MLFRAPWLALALLASGMEGYSSSNTTKPSVACGSHVIHDDIERTADQVVANVTIIVATTPWEPFSYKNASARHGWSGIDFALLDGLRKHLGFDYVVVEFDRIGNETWTKALLRIAPQVDVVLTYWGQSAERLTELRMLRGHIDLSSVVATRMESTGSTQQNRWFSFLSPFSVDLWVLVVLMVFLSGVVDYYLERKSGDSVRLTASLYEYFAGTMWGGFEYPRTKSSAFYQLWLSFIILVTVSAYTANLAAFLARRSSPTMAVNSLEEMSLTTNLKMCSYRGMPTIAPFGTVYDDIPPILFPGTAVGMSDLAQNLVTPGNPGCHAILIPKIQYDLYKMKRDNCNMYVAETTLPLSAGWVMSRRSSCVGDAFEYGFHRLWFEGVIATAIADAIPPYDCTGVPLPPAHGAPSPPACSASAAGARRELSAAPAAEGGGISGSSDGSSDGSVAAPLDTSRPPAERGLSISRSWTRRRLAAAAAGASSGGASGAAAGEIETPKLELEDFAGIFYLWMAVTSGVLFCAWLQPRMQRLRKKWRIDEQVDRVANRIQQIDKTGRSLRSQGSKDTGSDPEAKKKPLWKSAKASLAIHNVMQRRLARERTRQEGMAIRRNAERELRAMGIDINDESGMMRSCLAQILQMKQRQEIMMQQLESAKGQQGGHREDKSSPAPASPARHPPADDSAIASQRVYLQRAEVAIEQQKDPPAGNPVLDLVSSALSEISSVPFKVGSAPPLKPARRKKRHSDQTHATHNGAEADEPHKVLDL